MDKGRFTTETQRLEGHSFLCAASVSSVSAVVSLCLLPKHTPQGYDYRHALVARPEQNRREVQGMQSRTRSFALSAIALLFVAVWSHASFAQQFDASTYAGLRWRMIGPFRAGRVNGVTGVPGHNCAREVLRDLKKPKR